MHRKNYNELIASLTLKRSELCGSKGADYADTDILSNFKRVSEVAGLLKISPGENSFDYAMFMALMKIDRIMNLTSQNKQPNNESLEDSFMDLLNYIELGYALLEERKV